MQVAIHHGNERARGAAAADQLIPSDIVITTYGTLSRDVESLSEVRWGTLVLDEAQAVKNHLTRAAKAIRQIPANQKLALTGTPVENHLGELWSILDAVNPGLYGSALACGGHLSESTLGVASKTVPCGAKVTFRHGNRTVRVPVVDRGPYVGGRDWDLTMATAKRLGFGYGVGSVLSTK